MEKQLVYRGSITDLATDIADILSDSEVLKCIEALKEKMGTRTSQGKSEADPDNDLNMGDLLGAMHRGHAGS